MTPRRHVDPVRVSCPRCGSQPGELCTYVSYRGLPGRTTRRYHNQRWQAAALRGPGPRPATATRRAAAAAELEFDRREWERLRAWLAAHHGVLTGAVAPGD